MKTKKCLTCDINGHIYLSDASRQPYPKRPSGSTWPAPFCSGIRIGPRLPSNWPGIAPSPSARPIATSSRHNDSSTQSRSAMSKYPSPSSFRAVSYGDSAPTPLRPD